MKTAIRIALIPFVVLAMAFSACLPGCGASARERTIKTALVAVNDLRDAFVSLDEKIQMAIVETAKTHEEGSERLAVYRKGRERAVQAFESAYRLIAIAATAEEAPLATLLGAVKNVEHVINEMKAVSP